MKMTYGYVHGCWDAAVLGTVVHSSFAQITSMNWDAK